jgi:oxalyl-CoA decarboxylase
MADTALKERQKPEATADALGQKTRDVDATPGHEPELTDGFHLIIDALKLNGVKTLYGVPGIPITDFGRMAQAEGIRVLSFRH